MPVAHTRVFISHSTKNAAFVDRYIAGRVLPKPLKSKLGFIPNDIDADVGIKQILHANGPSRSC